MEIKNHIGFRNDEASELILYLFTNGIKFDYDEGCSISSLDIYESSPHWPVIAGYIQKYQLLSISETVFTKTELAQAEWLTLRSKWRNGYPQPENDYKYETITYTRDTYCPVCGCGLVQADAFRLKSAPKWGQRHFFELNWIGDEVFASETAKSILEENHISGVEFSVVKSKKGDQIFPNVYQLKISSLADCGLVEEKTGLKHISRCSHCGEIKYTANGRGPLVFLQKTFENTPDVVKTCEYFGWGHYASRKIIISQHVYRIICANHLDRGLVFEPVKLI